MKNHLSTRVEKKKIDTYHRLCLVLANSKLKIGNLRSSYHHFSLKLDIFTLFFIFFITEYR